MEWAVGALIAIIAFFFGYAVRSMKGASNDTFKINTPTRSGNPAAGAPGQPTGTRQANAKQLSSDAMAEVEELLLRGKKIEAIKAYREATGSGLKESKEAVEAIQRQLLNPANSA